MRDQRPIGVMGGTFDPVHNAHLRSALELLEGLKLAEVRFTPAGRPPHRDPPVATPRQRLEMLELALAGQGGFVIDDRELRRDGPSYMVDTLSSLRAELGERPLCLLLGMDAFDHLHEWHRWQEIPELAHLVVMLRPGVGLPLSQALGDLLAERKIHHPEDLAKKSAGGILFEPVSQLDISATRIRELLGQDLSPRYLLPEAVWNYIRERGLYRSAAARSTPTAVHP